MITSRLLALGVALCIQAVSCAAQPLAKGEGASVTASRQSVADFGAFIRGISLLAQQEPASLKFSTKGGPRSLTLGPERSFGVEFPDMPIVIHLGGDEINWGTGPTRQEVDLTRLEERLEGLVEAAAKTSSQAIPVLIVGAEVSGDRGFKILEMIVAAGITHLRLADPDPIAQVKKDKPNKPRIRIAPDAE